MNDETKKLIDEIKYRRKLLNLTQTELALKCGMPQSTIGRIENYSMNPSLDIVTSILKELNMSLSLEKKHMRVLFEIDYKNYKENGTIGYRPSARAIIIKDNKYAMVYSKKYDYYKFPGGGIKSNETNEEALIREVKEEVGLEIVRNTIKEYGLVIRKEAGKIEDIFIQENYYYFCEITNTILSQNLDDYEKEEGFTLRWVEASVAIETNLKGNHNNCSDNNMHIIEREAKVLKMLVD